jgi:hypothetical protein
MILHAKRQKTSRIRATQAGHEKFYISQVTPGKDSKYITVRPIVRSSSVSILWDARLNLDHCILNQLR